MSFINQILERVHAPDVRVGSAHQQLTTDGTAKTLATLGYTAPTTDFGGALLQVTGGDVRYTLTGTTPPTASLGFLGTDGQSFLLTTADVANARFITASGSPKLDVQAIR